MGASGDRYIERIRQCMYSGDYQEAIHCCDAATAAYETLRVNQEICRKALHDIEGCAVHMDNAAEYAESSLKDDIGKLIIRGIRMGSQDIINICCSADDAYDVDTDSRAEYVSNLKTMAQRMQNESG